MSLVKIRPIKESEIFKLEDMLYEAIFQPEGYAPIPRTVLDVPEVNAYIQDFGTKKDDYCLVADLNGEIIGAVWVRIISGEIKGYGNVDAETPEFSISLFKEYRNQEIGTKLMQEMIEYLRSKGYKQASLDVQKANYAAKMYKKLGFEVIKETKDTYLMLLRLN